MSRPPDASRKPASASLTLYVDGAARGNPGPAGAGVVLCGPDGRVCRELRLYLGEATNNVAEYSALLLGLQEAVRMGVRQVRVRTDSELLARQVAGEYRVKDRHLRLFHALVGHLAGGFRRFDIEHVPRAQNRQADRLANRAVTEGVKQEGRGQLSLFPDG